MTRAERKIHDPNGQYRRNHHHPALLSEYYDMRWIHLNRIDAVRLLTRVMQDVDRVLVRFERSDDFYGLMILRRILLRMGAYPITKYPITGIDTVARWIAFCEAHDREG